MRFGTKVLLDKNDQEIFHEISHSTRNGRKQHVKTHNTYSYPLKRFSLEGEKLRLHLKTKLIRSKTENQSSIDKINSELHMQKRKHEQVTADSEHCCDFRGVDSAAVSSL